MSTALDRTHEAALAETAVQAPAAVHGTVLQPGDAEYETARRVYNGMIDRRPRLIVR